MESTTNSNSGIFKEISREMCEALKEIVDRGNDAEIRKRRDGTYDVYELEKKRHTPRKDTK